MTEFEGQIWVAQDNDEVNFICTIKRIKNKIQAINEKGRELRIAEDKLLWQHPSVAKGLEDWRGHLTKIQATVNSLYNDIDVALLWESALELKISTLHDLADLYFGGEITTEHLTAIWQVLLEDRLYFKRRGRNWEARTAEQVNDLTTQRERELARVKAQALAREWLQQLAKIPLPVFPSLSKNSDETVFQLQLITVSDEIVPFVERLEAWLRGNIDKDAEELITRLAETVKLTPREFVFETLQKIGRLPIDADRDVIVAGLKSEFSPTVNEAAQVAQTWQPSDSQNITELLFSIDDEETREVDDALAIEREGTLWKITIAIADPATVIHRGDVLDREAMKRGTTVYLPTQTVLMLPKRISCDIASLTPQCVRSSIVTRAWVDEQGKIIKSSMNREAIQVLKRLHYSEADNLIAQGEDKTAKCLRDLLACAKHFHAQRLNEGAFNLQRPEYKISVKEETITVTMIEKNSPSRLLVGEMMILANHIAAKYAYTHQVPVIYRVQHPPLEPITEEMTRGPLGFHKARKFLGRSSLSLQAGRHSGLGLSMYTQLTSPLRRCADLVMQRQLMAHLVSEPLPYNVDELFKVLETAERTTREARSVENEAKKRWLMQYLKQNGASQPFEALVVVEAKGGYKVEMQPWGVEAYLGTSRSLEFGQRVEVVIDKIRVKAGTARLKLA